MESQQQQQSSRRSVLVAYLYTAVWIALSSAVILINKWILDPALGDFPFPLTLSATHQLVCSAAAAALVRFRVVDAGGPMPPRVYARGVVPVGVLFAVSLAAGNAAVLHLSVSFVQMLKASMPLLVFLAGAAAGAERFERGVLLNMLVVVGGVAAASYGEARFVGVGVVLQGVALLAEAARLVMVQQLLQRSGVRLNAITAMHRVSPVCLAALLPAMLVLEARPLWALLFPTAAAAVRGGAGGAGGSGGTSLLLLAAVLGSAAAAFCLNCAVFLLVGRTSALTMNVAGVVKDWMLIAASVALHGAVVTRLQCGGYAVAMLGVCYYNWRKVRSGQLVAAGAATAQGGNQRPQRGGGDAEAAHGGGGGGGGGKGDAASHESARYYRRLVALRQGMEGEAGGTGQQQQQQQQQLPQAGHKASLQSTASNKSAASLPLLRTPLHSCSAGVGVGGGGGGGGAAGPVSAVGLIPAAAAAVAAGGR